MNLLTQSINKVVVIASIIFLVSSCTNTKISQSWVDPDLKKSYNDILIIGIGESEQNRRAYESYFSTALEEKGIEALASYKLIKSNAKIDRETIGKAIKGLNVDGVIVTHLTAVDEETIYRPSMDYMPMYGGGYYGGLYSYYPHVNAYVTRPGYYETHETYTLETNLYDVESEELVWSARSRSFAPESVDEVITDLTKLLIEELIDKGLIKKK
ncbi:MAG: hypothetical protein COB77_06530 [Gammaproteobacteria bacterium]|nr:MAG: hypothetical protein COB77_06530 [Gammaproteobacteria bacterium]